MTGRLCMFALIVLAGLIGGCDRDKGDYVAVEGGGFVFNYRIAEAFYGVNLRPQRRLERGTTLEVSFEDPAGGPPIIVREVVTGPALRHTFRTPPVTGVQGNRTYAVSVTVYAVDGRTVLQRLSHTIRSDLDQSILPDKPLTIGPGYQRPG